MRIIIVLFLIIKAGLVNMKMKTHEKLNVYLTGR